MRAISHGFRVYSPEGAEWGTTTIDTLNIGWPGMFGSYLWLIHYHPNGIGADTVALSANALQYDTGLPWGFDDSAFTITIGPIDTRHEGSTICVDSSYYGGGGIWKWIDGQAYEYYPEWDGPHCFTIVNSTIEISGNAAYWDLNPEVYGGQMIRNARVEMWDEDPGGGTGNDDLLATATSDNQGYFDFGSVDNSEVGEGTGQDVYFRIYAENDVANVTLSPGGSTEPPPI